MGLFLLATGCTNILLSRKDSPAPQIRYAAGTYARWNGLPYYLPTAKVRVDGTWNKDSKEWDVKITPIIEPDVTNVFTLHSNANALFDDDTSIGIDTNGLLSTVTATSEDKTVSALGDLIAAAANAMSFGAGLSPKTSFKNLKDVRDAPPYPATVLPSSSFRILVDPLVPADTDSLWVSAPPGSGIGTTDRTNQYAYVSVRAEYSAPALPLGATEDSTATNIEGIVVRLLAPVTVKITPHIILASDLPALLDQKKDLTSSIYTSDPVPQTIMLPDVRGAYVLPIKRRYLVKDVTKVGLVNGTVQVLGVTRPSIVAGFVGIPKTILGALVPIPLQIRTTVLNNVKAVNDTRALQETTTTKTQ